MIKVCLASSKAMSGSFDRTVRVTSSTSVMGLAYNSAIIVTKPRKRYQVFYV